jgi:hypothetical protein
MGVSVKQLIADNREKIYRALKIHDFQRYRDAIQSAEAVSLTFDLPQNVAAEIEAAVVLSVADALGVKP